MKISFLIIILILIMSVSGVCQTNETGGPPAWMNDLDMPAGATLEPVAKPKSEPVTSPTVFNDVPDTHWARSGVYDLVKLGITQGYPDGTFRGDKRINRYETAMFLARLLEKIEFKTEQYRQANIKEYKEKYEPKLRAELEEIRKEMQHLSDPEIERPEFGYFKGTMKMGNFTSIGALETSNEASTGPRFDYRLKMSFDGWANKWLYCESNFDTMDSLWGSGNSRALATELIDVTGKVKSPMGFDIFFTAGPGPIVHSEEASTAFPADNGIVFMRPRNSFGVIGKNSGLDWMFEYSVADISYSGEAIVSDYRLKFGHNFDEDTSFAGVDELSTTMDYNVKDGLDPADVFKESFLASFKPKWGFEFSFRGGFSSVKSEGENYYYAAGITFNDLIKEGMKLELDGVRVGEHYLNYPDYLAEESLLGVNYFDKFYDMPGGGADFGLKITQNVSETTRMVARGNVVLDDKLSYGKDNPGTHTTFEIKIDFLTYTFSSIGFIYKIYHEPSRVYMPTSDMFAIEGKYEF